MQPGKPVTRRQGADLGRHLPASSMIDWSGD
jgi:hypothetical protein